MDSLRTTAADLTRALVDLQASMVRPLLLIDALRLKRVRGDADCAEFKAFAKYQFGSGLNASVPGALNAMRQWLAKGVKTPDPVSSAFVADLDAIQSGTFASREAA